MDAMQSELIAEEKNLYSKQFPIYSDTIDIVTAKKKFIGSPAQFKEKFEEHAKLVEQYRVLCKK